MNDEDGHASQVALTRTNLYSIQPRLSIDAVRSMMGLWLMPHFNDIEDAFDFFSFGQRIRGILNRETVKLCLCTFLCLSACSYVSFSWFLPSLSVGADPANFGGHPSHLRFRTEENLSLLTSLKHLLLRMDAPWRPRSVLPGDLSVLSIIGQRV